MITFLFFFIFWVGRKETEKILIGDILGIFMTQTKHSSHSLHISLPRENKSGLGDKGF